MSSKILVDVEFQNFSIFKNKMAIVNRFCEKMSPTKKTKIIMVYISWTISAINSLTTLMHLKSGGQKVIILIDGYDSPIINQHRFADSNEFNDSLTLVNDWIQAFVSAKNVELLLVVGTFWFPLSGMNFHHFGVDESRPPAGRGACISGDLKK